MFERRRSREEEREAGGNDLMTIQELMGRFITDEMEFYWLLRPTFPP
jgi:hypothetical protein